MVATGAPDPRIAVRLILGTTGWSHYSSPSPIPLVEGNVGLTRKIRHGSQ